MVLAVAEFDDQRATTELTELAASDTDALDQACDACFATGGADLATRRRAIELLAQARYGDSG